MAQSYLCAQGEVDPTSEEEKQRLKEEAKKLRLQGQNPDEAPDNDFMSEAKVRDGDGVRPVTGPLSGLGRRADICPDRDG